MRNIETLRRSFPELSDIVKISLKGGNEEESSFIEIDTVDVFGGGGGGGSFDGGFGGGFIGGGGFDGGFVGGGGFGGGFDGGFGGGFDGGFAGGGGGGTSSEPTYDGGTIETVVITVNAQNAVTIGDTLSTLFTFLGLTATQAEVNALAANVTIPGLELAGKALTLVGVGFNLHTFIQDPNWQDAGQIVLGGLVIATGGTTAIALGTALTVWELYELYQKSQASTTTITGTIAW